MAKKILIAVAVLIILLLVGNLLLSRFASDLVETELRNVFQQDQTNRFDIDFESANVNTLSSTITVKNVRFTDKEDNATITSDSFSLNLKLADIIRSARNTDGNVDISEAQFRVNNFEYLAEDGVQGLRASHIFLDINGDINNFIRSIQAGRTPSMGQVIKGDFNNLTITRAIPISETVTYDETTTFNRIQTSLTFTELIDELKVDYLDIQMPNVNTSISGVITNFNTPQRRMANLKADINLLDEFLPVGEDGAKLEFEKLSLNFDGPFAALTSVPAFVSSNNSHITTQMESVVLTPPDTYQQSLGRNLDALGVPTDRIFLPSIKTDIRIHDQIASVEKLDVDTGFGLVSVAGNLNIDSVQPALSTWQDGTTIQIRPQTQELNQFIGSMAGFLGIPLQREEYGFSVGLSGTLTSPFIPGLNL